MDLLLEKLGSRHGTSIIFALLFLLVASAAVSVSLSAAAAVAARTAADRLWQQDHLALTSAAELLADCLQETEARVSVERTTVVTDESSTSEAVSVSSASVALAEPCPLASTLGSALLVAIRYGSEQRGLFDITTADSPAKDVLKTVHVSYTITPEFFGGFSAAEELTPVQLLYDYHLLASLTVGDESGAGQTLYLSADSRSDSAPEVTAAGQMPLLEDGPADSPAEQTSIAEILSYGITWERVLLSTQKEQLRTETGR